MCYNISIKQLVQTIGPGQAEIAAELERRIAEGELVPGARLPPVRELAASLGVSPATVAAAYRTLKQRGLVSADGRRGTTVAPEPPFLLRPAPPLPSGVRDLARGNPDPELLPPLASAVARLDLAHKLYGGPANLDALVELAREDFAADGVQGELAIVGGALDGIERVLQARLRPGDAVAVEDPTWARITDLVRSLGLVPVPVPLDERGVLPDDLAKVLPRVRALIVTPRAQNPTGAALDDGRAEEVRGVLARHPEALVVEDDYAAAVAGVEYHGLHAATARWIVIRSLSKVLGPDLRIALVAGDRLTVRELAGRQLLGPGWVSHLLQQLAADLLGRAATRKLLARAARTYAERRQALIDALDEHGIRAQGRSGLGVWLPLRDEAATVQSLLEQGWAVSPGERYRIRAEPGIRITTTTLEPAEAKELAAAIAGVAAGSETYAG